MEKQALAELCTQMDAKNIIVVGDIILDHFIYGSVDRISPESPVPVLAKKREKMMLGGAGNSFANLIGLHTQATLLSVIGDDREGALLKKLIKDKKASDKYLVTDKSRPTSIKTRFLAGHQQLLRADCETKTPINNECAKHLLKNFDKILPQADAIIISDYDKGVLRDDVITHIISQANARSIPVIIDPKGTDFSIYRGADAITPNRKELSDATKNHPTKTDEDVIKAARILIKDCGIKSVIATRSGDGISVIKAGLDDVYHARPEKEVEVFDVSGAGDTVIATIAATLAAKGSLEQAAELANIAGHIAVTKVGTAPIRRDEIINEITYQTQSNGKTLMAPLLTPEAAQEYADRWRAKGFKVGFTNGCFDIIHAGHVTYLNETKDHCDRLIIGLNSDTSVKVLKGESRPIHDEGARAAVLGALASADAVVLFGAKKHGDDNTANTLINTIKPDIYFKGGDYQIDDIPETPTVRTYGGEVKVLQVVEGYSTTKAIEKSKSS